MSDREFSGNDDLSLPKATVQKMIAEILQPASRQSFARDARDLLIECCSEFINLVSSEANEISEREAKKTIAVEHIEKALTELGFQEYVPDVRTVADEFKDQQKAGSLSPKPTGIFGAQSDSCCSQTREKKQNKMETSGLSEEELLRMQEAMLSQAREKYNAGPDEA